jgi:hypothetical protein
VITFRKIFNFLLDLVKLIMKEALMIPVIFILLLLTAIRIKMVGTLEPCIA